MTTATREQMEESLRKDGIDINNPSSFQNQQPQQMQQPQAQQPPQQGFLGGAAKATGESLWNQFANLGNVVSPLSQIPGMDIPHAQEVTGPGSTTGHVLGGAIGLLGPGGLARGAIREGAAAAPSLLQKGAQYLNREATGIAGEGNPLQKLLTKGTDIAPSLLRRGLGTGAYEAIQHPGERGKEALKGAGLSMALDLAFPGLGAFASAFRPQKIMDELKQALGGGKSLDVTRRELAADIKANKKNVEDISSKNFNEVLKPHGNKSIYIIPKEGEKFPEKLSSSYRPTPEALSAYGNDLQKLHAEFKRAPTLNNAHKLQSDLLKRTNELKSNLNKTTSDWDKIKELRDLRSSLKSDTEKFLDKVDPSAANKWKEASTFHREEVIPYTKTKLLRDIGAGEVENLTQGNVTSLFGNPKKFASKISEHLGDEGRKKILHQKIGPAKTPEELLGKMQSLEHTGFSPYVTNALKETADKLQARLGRRDIAGKAASIGLGALAGGPFGPMGHIIGGGLGLKFAPQIMKAIPGGKTISKLGNYSDEIKELLRGALLGGAGGNQ